MKKSILTLCAVLAAPALLLSQVPDAFSYQAIARDASGDALTNQSIGIEIKIHEGSAVGPVIYSETHNPTTNEYGLFSIAVGGGIPGVGVMFPAGWEQISGGVYLEVGLDPAGGSTYVSMGTQQILSVPFASSATNAEMLFDSSLVSRRSIAPGGNRIWAKQGYSVGIGTETPDGSALLDVSSTTQGLLPPRMTEAERDAIVAPAAGLMVYCTDCGLGGEIEFYNGTAWNNLAGGATSTAFTGSQMGSDIDGEAFMDQSGSSVSLSADGSCLAIGAIANDGNGNFSGHVRIYNWSGSAWLQLGSDIDGEAATDESGNAVSLSADGSQVAIGASKSDGIGIFAGHVRVYSWSGSAWVQMGSDIDGEAAEDRSGHSVSLSADGFRVAIGARYNDGNGSDAGHMRIYSWSGSAWLQLGSDIDGEAADDWSGAVSSMSADGSRVVIGAYANDGNGSGHVRIYGWNGSAWVQLGSDIDGEAADDGSGGSLSMSADGSRVAIGAQSNDGNGNNAGHVRIYSWSGSTWLQMGSDIDGEAADDGSGASLSMSADGSRVAIGARLNDGSASNAGHVRIYDWSGTAWVQWGSDIDGEAADDWSGHSVSMSADGSRVAIAAPFNNGNGSNAGHVRVFD